ncbi:MAG: MBL fold metallo-hydrolase [Chloroflexi bacterium]|nr:MAG: MBL fold metallo-hydrolase [Chloroflexota bacterium]
MSSVRVTILMAGHCTCPEHIAIQGGRWRNIHFPAMFALIEHPRCGPMLFDTGYSERFFSETRRFPNRLYRLATPVTLEEKQTAQAQLAARGIRPSDIERVFISHFHADHIAALGDFPRARYVYLPQAFEAVRSLAGWRALARAYLPGLLPSDFTERAAPVDMAAPRPLPPDYAPFATGFDLLGDESLLAVELPGHCTGQMGLLARREDGIIFFFVADAAWLMRSIAGNRLPHALANLIFSNPRLYRLTLAKLHRFHVSRPEVAIIPSHCAETLARYTG